MKPIALHEAMKNRRLSLGMFSNGEMMGTMAAAGFNHIILDHMFTPLDWRETAALCATARVYGLAPIVRVQTYPWTDEPRGDMGAISEVARARMIGAAGAMVSISSAHQLKSILRVASDFDHFGVPGYRAVQAYREAGANGIADMLPPELRDFPVVAYIENAELLGNLEEIASLAGLQAIGFGIHDVCFTSDHPYEVEHPDVWRVIDRGVELAKRYHLSVWTNTGYIYTRAEETAARIRRLYDRGVDTIQVQTPDQFLNTVLTDIADSVYGSQTEE
jgi:2-keto-3-deoxy-L-rhamnonate aldolase RhmA